MADRIGQQLGNYRLVRLLGRGGFAEVYLGEHVYLGTQAAIKVLSAQVTGRDTDHFLAEARTIAHLKHPHIVGVLEFGIEKDTPYLVLEYAPYGSLRQRYPRGTRLPLPVVVAYVNQVASALQYAHEQKLIHRDVKPENMLIWSDKEIKLSDFGIAMIAQTSSYQTQHVIGTVAYMAPEQLQGRPRPASDQYSLGIVVYEWLSGTCPFRGSFTEVASQQVLVPPPPLQERVPGIPPTIEQAVMVALAKDPQQRFARVSAFAYALEQAWQLEIHTPTVLSSPLPLPDTVTATPKLIPSVQAEQSPPSEGALHAASTSAPSLTSSFTKHPVELTVPALLTPSASRATPRLPETHARDRRISPIAIPVLSAVLAVLVIGASILLYYTVIVAPGQFRAQATAVAQTATSLTTTAQAQASATASSPQGVYALATSGTPVLDDALSSQSSSQWDETPLTKLGGCQFSGGAYHAIATQKNLFFPCYAEASNFSNFVFQVQMIIIKGDGGGLVFRANSANCEEYAFFVNQDGSYDFSMYSGCSPGQTLYYSSIYGPFNQGLNQSNLITVIARQDTFSFYANRRFIVSYSDSTYTSGKIGVAARNDTHPTEVVYTNAQVWQI